MKRKEKIIGSLIIAIIAILFLFIGYSKTNDKKISDSDMEKLFLDREESEEKGLQPWQSSISRFVVRMSTT